MRTRIRLQAQPEPMRSIVGATQQEQRRGLAWNWCVCRDVHPNKIIPEWIYNANTKGPWSETRGPAIGGPVYGPEAQLHGSGAV